MDGMIQLPLFCGDIFEGFGLSRFRPAEESIIGRQLRSGRPGRLRSGVCDHAPVTPGVYGMIDARNRIIYVGKAKNLRTRLMSYFRENSRDPKAGKIIRQTRTLVWEQTGDELAALLRELELIRTLRPRLNVLGVPGVQRYHYLCIGKSPAPCVYVTNNPTGKELGIYGPLVVRDHSEEAARDSTTGSSYATVPRPCHFCFRINSICSRTIVRRGACASSWAVVADPV